MSDSVFERFVKDSPISVTARATAERALNPEKIDAWSGMNAQVQYTKDLLISSVCDLMGGVVTCNYPSVHTAYQHSKDVIGVSVTSVYNKFGSSIRVMIN